MHAKGDGSNFDINIEEADNAAAVAHTLLSRGASEMIEENIGMLAGLASVIYRNTPALCNHVWLDWEDYCSKADARIQKEQQHNALR
eukprot:15317213-Ditylum_brightwellii.AAC.1